MRLSQGVVDFLRMVGVAVCVIFVHSLAFSADNQSVTKGVGWLASQVTASGGLMSAHESLAHEVQARHEVLEALLSSGAAFIQPYDADIESTESLSRRILFATRLGQDAAHLQEELLSWRNADGGFGSAKDWSSNPLDTAYALIESPLIH